MRIKKYQNLYQFTFFPQLFPINAYIYEEAESLTVVDVGVASFCKPMIEVSKLLNKPIKNIILTHAHKDHVNGLDTLKQMVPEAEVFISERDSHLLKGDFQLHSNEEKTPIKGGFCKLKTSPNHLLYGNDYVGSLKVLSIPGHTPGSIALLDASGIVIAGDSFQTKGGIAVSGDKRFFFPFPALATWSKKEALKSAKKLVNSPISLLATGHGEMMENPNQAMIQAISRIEKEWNR